MSGSWGDAETSEILLSRLSHCSVRKLARFADQIGASRRLVYTKFQSAMNDLLQDIQDQFFDDQKQTK